MNTLATRFTRFLCTAPVLFAVSEYASAQAASFTYEPPNPSVFTQVSFRDASTSDPVSWHWNFGDPSSGALNTSSSPNPTHTYAQTGTYPVTLTVECLCGGVFVVSK